MKLIRLLVNWAFIVCVAFPVFLLVIFLRAFEYSIKFVRENYEDVHFKPRFFNGDKFFWEE